LKSRRNNSLLWAGLVVSILGFVILLGWINYRYSVQNPGGNDFLVHWMGTRTFLTEGISPYSDETAKRIQVFAYGHPAGPGEHQLRVAYPLYSIVFFLPYALVPDFNVARALWMTTLEVALLLLAYFSMRLAYWKPDLITLAVFFLFSILWYHGLRPLINGNAVILVALGLVAGFLALRAGADEVAGVLFAFTTIKPQVVLLILAFVMFWAFMQKRWRLIIWTIVPVLILSAIGAFFLPDWILQNLREVIRYPSYNPPGTPGAAFAVWFPAMGQRLGLILTGIMGAFLVVEWIRARHADERGFLWTACITLVVSQWIGIQTDPGNFIVLFPALVLVFATWEERWRRIGRVLSIFTMFAVAAGIWVLFLNTVQYGAQPIQSPIMFFPLPGVLLILLYWVRWWAIRPPNVWFDMLYSNENPKLL
jgi:hypothetical protein